MSARGGRANLGDLIFDLCVNFLLYCALIIVFYMLVRFYLEEDIVHANSGYEQLSADEEDETISRKNTVDLLDEENTSKINNELEYSDAETDDQQNFLKKEAFADPHYAEIKFEDIKKRERHDSSDESRQDMLQRVLYYGLSLNVVFSILGLVQERIITQPYDGDYFESSYGLVFVNRLGGLILSFVLMYYNRTQWAYSPLWEYSFPSVANMLSSWCQYEALKYVSFPTQMLAKAFKIVPVMLMGKFLNEKTYEGYEYISAFMIGFGLYLFLNSSENIDLKNLIFGTYEDRQDEWCGVVLLILFLFFDSFTGQFQTRMFVRNKEITPIQMMLITNAFSAVFSFVTLIHQEELFIFFQFIWSHQDIISHLIVFFVCSTIGQLLIFNTVKNFGPLVFSIFMTIRILCSTLLSCFVYSHPITEMGVIGIIIVFGAIAYRIQKKLEQKPLKFWKQKTNLSNIKIVHEWHEHLDI